jgi:hypothetical protein
MAELDRTELAAQVAKLMVDPEFVKSLTIIAKDGSRPILPALSSDKVSEVAKEIHAAMDGAANVVVHFLNTYMVVPIQMVSAKEAQIAGQTLATLARSTTMGLFIARVDQDVAAGLKLVYCISEGHKKASDHPKKAEVAAVGRCVAAVA